MPHLGRFRSLYAGVFVAAGLALLIARAAKLLPPQPVELALYVLLACAGGLLTVRDSVEDGMPAGFPILLLGLQELSLGKIVAVACLATAVRELSHRGEGRKPQVGWRIAGVALSTVGGQLIYNVVASAFGVNVLFPLPLLMASLTFVLYGVMVRASSRADNVSVRDAAMADATALLPWYIGTSYIACLIRYTGNQTGLFPGVLMLPVMVSAHLLFRLFARIQDQHREHVKQERTHADELAALHLRIIEALALTVEAKDSNTHMHLRRVQVYAVATGQELQLSSLELQALHAAAYLHDIGKLAVPEYIVSKPGKLTGEEFEKMKIHPIVGGEILARLNFPYPVAPIVRAHHEKFDGSGYPYGLAGDEIPIGARILAAVDCLDAVASDRPYRLALPLQEAMARVVSESGKSFDPQVVEVLQRRYTEFEKMARAAAVEAPLVPVNLRVARGGAPATGLEGFAGELGAGFGSLAEPIASAQREQSAVYELLGRLASSLTVDEIFNAVKPHISKIVGYEAIVAYLRTEDSLSPVYIGGDRSHHFVGREFPVGTGLSGWVAEHQKAIVNGNPSVEACYVQNPRDLSRLESALAIPLEGERGAIGVLTLYCSTRDAFSREHLRVLRTLSSTIGSAMEKALRYHHAQSSARTDHLTGIPNARSLTEHLEREIARARRSSSPLAVLLCDLDGFKQVNDTYGHLKGNEVLVMVAKNLQAVCRGSDYVARMGGDEFVIVMAGQQDTNLESQNHRLRRVAEQAGEAICGEEVLSMSIGIANFPSDGANAADLLAAADQNMYAAKAARKGARISRKHRAGLPAAELTPETVEVASLASAVNDLQSLAGGASSDQAWEAPAEVQAGDPISPLQAK